MDERPRPTSRPAAAATPADEVTRNVLASVAQYETEVRAERVRAGQAIARVSGNTWRDSKPGRMLHVTLDQIRTIRRIKHEGERISAIARATGLSRPTVYARLRPPV